MSNNHSQNPKKYPLTTHFDLSADEQHLIDIYNYKKLESDWSKGYPIKPNGLAIWKELSEKLNLPYLPKDKQCRLPIELAKPITGKEEKKYYTVGEVAKEVGLSTSGVYFYEKMGLLAPDKIDRIKYYTKKTIERIKKIKELEKSHFLSVIREILKKEEN